MKVNFITKLNTWLFVMPALFILAAYFGIGIWFYFSGASYVLKDFHAAQLMTMLSDKKNSVELWIDVRKKALEEIAKSGVVTDSLQKLAADRKALDPTAGDVSERGKKAAADDAAEAGQRISKYLEGASQFKSISFLSAEGVVIWSTNTELTGREWPDKDIFIKGLGRADVIAARLNPVAGADGFLFSLPFLIRGEQGIQMLIIAQPNPADLAASLRVEKGFYETGKVSVIDASGNVVAAKDMTDVGMRYNIRPSGLEAVDYREGLYYSVSALKNEPLRLIATLASVEAAKPLKPLLTVYLAFAGLVVAVILLQCVLIAPRLLEKPLLKLAKASQSISDGDLRAVSIRKGYIGELKTLAEAVSRMVIDLNKKWSLPGGRTSELSSPKTSPADIFAAEVKLRLEEIEKSLAESGAGARAAGLAAEIKGLVMTLDDLAILMKISDGSIKLTKKECSVGDILRDVEEAGVSLVGGREIGLIVEYPETATGKKVETDLRLLKRVGTALLRSAIRLTEVGTITLLASFVTRDGSEYLELCVSDTGRGLDEAAIGKILKGGSYYSQYLELCIGRDLAVKLGGGISIESMPGKGSLVTVVIPANPQAPETNREENI